MIVGINRANVWHGDGGDAFQEQCFLWDTGALEFKDFFHAQESL